MSLTPKNWAEFQHYTNRRPPWIKLHRTLLDDPDFQRLPVASRALAPMLWLLASEQEDGAIHMDAPSLAYRLRMSDKDLIDAIKPLIERGFFVSDSSMLAPCKQDAIPETEGETYKEETKKRRTSRVDKLSLLNGYPDDALLVVKTLLPLWPTIAGDRTVEYKPHDAAARVTEILRSNRDVSPELLIESAKRYLSTENPKFVSALHFFFGPGKGKVMPKWEQQVRAVIHERKLA